MLAVFFLELALSAVQYALNLPGGPLMAVVRGVLMPILLLPILFGLVLRPVAQLAAKQAAASAEARFEAIAHAAGDAILILDVDWEIHFANRATEEMFGIQPGEWRKLLLGTFLTEDAKQVLQAARDKCQVNGETFLSRMETFELDMLRRDGNQFPAELRVSELREGQQCLLVAVLRDISERKRIETEMKRLAAFPRLNPNPVMECTGDGRILLTNEATKQLLEILGKKEAYATDLIPNFSQHAQRCLTEGKKVSGIEVQLGDQTLVWSMVPVGVGQLVCGHAMDITARKKVERELQERTTRLNALLANSPLGMVVLDKNNRVQMCNPAFEELFQYKSAEIAGLELDSLVASEELLAEALEMTKEGMQGRVVHAISQRRRKDGSLVDVEIHAVPLLIGGKLEGAYAIYQDVSERKKLQLYEQLLPVCCVCGKIRDDQGVAHGEGQWERLDHYVTRHSDTQFSHTFCPECLVQFRKEQGLG